MCAQPLNRRRADGLALMAIDYDLLIERQRPPPGIDIGKVSFHRSRQHSRIEAVVRQLAEVNHEERSLARKKRGKLLNCDGFG
jgi:hypothetical protein